MFRNTIAAVILLIGIAFGSQAHADYWFKVNDASLIQYQILLTPSQIMLRNLNSFDSTVLGCCYNYWIDLSTDAGKAMWATLLAKMETKEPIWVWVTSQTAAGAVMIVWLG
jgi:hypothetical protein